METPIRILVVEDEMLIGARLSMFLGELGYEVTGIVPRGEDVLTQISTDMPDLAILDVQLKGDMDGIALGELLYRQYKLPVIYLTANTDDATFQRAKSARPLAFLSKPFRKSEVQRAIELTISRMEIEKTPVEESVDSSQEEANGFIMADRIFIRQKDRMIKVLFESILYLEADRSYCRLFTRDKQYFLTMPMKALESRLPAFQFQRIHRSHIVNISHVDEVAEGYVYIQGQKLPLSQNLKSEFLQRFNMI